MPVRFNQVNKKKSVICTLTLLRYVTFLSCTLSPSSIPNYLNIVRLIYLQYGYPNPLENELLKFQYSLLIRGIKRASNKAATRPKLPITPSVLKEIRKQLTLTDSFDATFWAACLVAFYSFLEKLIYSRSQKISLMNVYISEEVIYTSLPGALLWLSDGTKLFNLGGAHC